MRETKGQPQVNQGTAGTPRSTGLLAPCSARRTDSASGAW